MTLRHIVLCAAFACALPACDDPMPPTPAYLEVQVATQGAAEDLDADGYMLRVDSEAPRRLDPNDNLILHHLEPGEHTVLIEDVASNCAHTGSNPQTITIDRGETAIASFALACVPSRGNLQISITTTGPAPDPDGYLLQVYNDADAVLFAERIPVNHELVLDDLPATGGYAVISDLAENCGVAGSNPRNVTVRHGSTTAIGFDVSCKAPLELEISLTTTGVHPQPDGYTISAASDGEWSSIAAPSNGAVRLTGLNPGRYTVTLLRADPSCQTATNPRTVVAPEGGLFQLAFDIECAQPREFALVSVADGDEEIYLGRDDDTDLVRLTNNQASDSDPTWSPDGARIAFTSDRDGDSEIYVMAADGTGAIRLTDNPAQDRQPAWSPDGATILFVSDRDGNDEIYAMTPEGTNVVRITTYGGPDVDPAWSPDGTRIAFIRDDLLNVMEANGSGIRAVTIHNAQYWSYRLESAPAWSPDGSRIAFEVVRCTHYYYYYDGECQPPVIDDVRPDGSDQKTLQATWAPVDPAWYPDGRMLAFTAKVCEFYCTRSIRLARPGIEVLVLVEDFARMVAWRP